MRSAIDPADPPVKGSFFARRAGDVALHLTEVKAL
jgi:hypothetical protein